MLQFLDSFKLGQVFFTLLLPSEISETLQMKKYRTWLFVRSAEKTILSFEIEKSCNYDWLVYTVKYWGSHKKD